MKQNTISTKTKAAKCSSSETIVRKRSSWLKMFSELLEFKAAHGNCLVPNRYTENRSLGFWVSTQRHQYKLMKKGKPSLMIPDRMQLLECAGFVWATRDPNHDPWEINYWKLVEYVKKHGTCNIETKKSKLGNWASTQRVEYKRFNRGMFSRMTDERIALLEKIGFNWQSKRGAAAAKVRNDAKVQSIMSQSSDVSLDRVHSNMIRSQKLPQPMIIEDSIYRPPAVEKFLLNHEMQLLDEADEILSHPADLVHLPNRSKNMKINRSANWNQDKRIHSKSVQVPSLPKLEFDHLQVSFGMSMKSAIKEDFSAIESAALGLLSFSKRSINPERVLKPISLDLEPPKRYF